MKYNILLHLAVMTSSLLIVGTLTHETDSGESSSDNLQKIKRIPMRRNQPKIPKFGWGKRSASSMDELMYDKDSESQDFRDKRVYSTNGVAAYRPPHWAMGSQVNSGGQQQNTQNTRKKCNWFNGCQRDQRSGWDSGYGRDVSDKLDALARARRRLELREDDTEDEDDFRKRQANRNGWNSAYGRRRRR